LQAQKLQGENFTVRVCCQIQALNTIKGFGIAFYVMSKLPVNIKTKAGHRFKSTDTSGKSVLPARAVILYWDTQR